MPNCVNELSAQLRETGLCYIPQVFSPEKIESINNHIDTYCRQEQEGIVYERDGKTIRAIHGPHLLDDFFIDIACNPMLLHVVQKQLGEAFYIHQYKINMKRGFEGKAWPWHQDFVFWQQNDHISEPRLLNIAIALDETTMLNGPLCFIPNSHVHGDLCSHIVSEGSSWRDDVSAELSFQINKNTVSELLSGNQPTFATGKPGDVYCFDPQIAHCSGNNMSPDDRRLLIITYNAVSNAPKETSQRPAFLCAVDTKPLPHSVNHIPGGTGQ